MEKTFAGRSKWVKTTAEGDISEFVGGLSKRVTLDWVVGHLKLLKGWGLAMDDLRDIVHTMKTNSIYSPIQTPWHKERLNRLKGRLKRRLREEFGI